MSSVIKVVIDKDIPFIKGVLEPYAEVVYLAGGDISREAISDADALIVRTRTKCSAELLSGSRLKAIFTATIGTDHIDTVYCTAHGIIVHSAPGCNAWGVVQYVITSLYVLSERRNIDIDGKTLGIIGAGNVGERLAWFAELLGFRVLRYDSPEQKRLAEDSNRSSLRGLDIDIADLVTDDYCTLDTLFEQSDIVSVHLPLTEETAHFCSEDFFGRLKEGAIFINSSRGEIVDEQALLRHRDRLGGLILDVWSREPNINMDLLQVADIATPHIAGYSLEGKINATAMVLRSFVKFFQVEELKEQIEYTLSDIRFEYKFEYGESRRTNLARLFAASYNVLSDDKHLRDNPEMFEYLRANYAFRREFSDELIEFVSL